MSSQKLDILHHQYSEEARDPRLRKRFEMLASGNPAAISVDDFRLLLQAPGATEFGLQLFHSFHLGKHVDFQAFCAIVSVAMNFDPSKTIDDSAFYFKVLGNAKEHISTKDFIDILYTAYALAFAVSPAVGPLTPPTHPIFSRLAVHAFRGNSTMDLKAFQRWIRKFSPGLFRGVHKWVELQCLGSSHGEATTPKQVIMSSPYMIPHFSTVEGAHHSLDFVEIWFLSTCLDPVFWKSGEWNTLFSTSVHGQSMIQFKQHVFNYRGPTVVMVEDFDKNVFLLCVDQEWREASSAWGGPHSKVLQLRPEFHMETFEMKLYDNTMTHGVTRNALHGVIMGANPGYKEHEGFSYWMDSELRRGIRSFGSGCEIGAEKKFEIFAVDTIGCGDAKLISSQGHLNKRDQLVAEQRQRVRLKDTLVEEMAVLELGGRTTAGSLGITDHSSNKDRVDSLNL